MKALATILIGALLAAGHPHPSAASPLPPSPDGRGKGPAREASGKGEGDTVAKIDAIAAQSSLAGEILIAKGDTILLDKGYGPIAPTGGPLHKPGERWRLASITKQVTAALILKQLAEEGESLDQKLSDDFVKLFHVGSIRGLTLRQLLSHHSGLANPDQSPLSPEGIPSFYTRAKPDLRFCLSKPAKPGSEFSYNNCDYIVAWPSPETDVWPARMQMAKLGETGIPGYVAGKPEPRYELATFGAAGGLMGTAHAVFGFDRSLMTGKLLPPAARAELWKPEGGRSYQALGQWVFPGTLKGCAAPKRIVQRDGEIGGVQVRNFIFPDDDLVVIVFTNRSSDDFKIGEVWEGKGFAYDLLSAAACP